MFSDGKKVIKQDGLRKLSLKQTKEIILFIQKKLHKNTNIMLEKTIQNI